MSKWDDLLSQIAKGLHDGSIVPGHVPIEMIQSIGDAIFKGVNLGFEAQGSDINAYTQLEELRQNVYYFSSFKSYAELREMNYLLTDSKGNIRPFNDFWQDVLKVNQTYNKNYLRAEYNHAINSSTMIVKWEKFKAEADVYSMLTYRTVGDGRVRVQHKELDGTTKPIDDKFWDTYFPPNDWNCRCDVEQTENENKDPASYPELKPIFKNNVGKTGVVFPKDHPYIDKVKDKKIATQISNASILAMPIESQWQTIKSFENGGKVLQHKLVNKLLNQYKRDFDTNYEIALYHAEKGAKAEILPILNGKEKEIIAKILPNKKDSVFPDLRIDDIYFEVESVHSFPYGKNTITNAVGHGAKQADFVVVTLPVEISTDEMFRIANGRFITHKNLQSITYKMDEKIIVFNRNNVL